MKKFLCIFVLLLSFLALTLLSAAQEPANGIGWHNEVTLTFRHCQKYLSPVYEVRGFWLWKHKVVVKEVLTPEGSEACNKDDSTIYAVRKGLNATTPGGRDAIIQQVFGTPTAPCTYIALSDDADPTTNTTCAAGATNCTVAGEKTANGLARATGLPLTHTNGNTTASLYHEYTYDGGAGTINIKGAALTNNATAATGVACFVYNFSPAPGSLTTNGDRVQVTWNLTATLT